MKGAFLFVPLTPGPSPRINIMDDYLMWLKVSRSTMEIRDLLKRNSRPVTLIGNVEINLSFESPDYSEEGVLAPRPIYRPHFTFTVPGIPYQRNFPEGYLESQKCHDVEQALQQLVTLVKQGIRNEFF